MFLLAQVRGAKTVTLIDIPGLVFVKSIGRGAHGEVFETLDELGRTVATKVWFRVEEPRRFERAREETQKLSAAGFSPMTVIVHKFGLRNGFPFAVMEFVRGNTLKARLLDKSDLSPAVKFAAWRMIYTALLRLYELGSVHGDPHTGNILLFEDHHRVYRNFQSSRFDDKYATSTKTEDIGVKLADFGTSLLWSDKKLFEHRECKVLCETVNRLFKCHELESVIDVSTLKRPRLLLEALDAYVHYLDKLETYKNARRMGKLDDEDLAVKAADDLGIVVGARPFFNLKAVIADFASLGVRNILRLFRNQMAMGFLRIYAPHLNDQQRHWVSYAVEDKYPYEKWQAKYFELLKSGEIDRFSFDYDPKDAYRKYYLRETSGRN